MTQEQSTSNDESTRQTYEAFGRMTVVFGRLDYIVRDFMIPDMLGTSQTSASAVTEQMTMGSLVQLMQRLHKRGLPDVPPLRSRIGQVLKDLDEVNTHRNKITHAYVTGPEGGGPEIASLRELARSGLDQFQPLDLGEVNDLSNDAESLQRKIVLL